MFELISKMYSEMQQGFKEVRAEMNLKLDEINKKLDMKADKNDIVRLENKFEYKSKALFDGYTQAHEKLAEIEKKLDDISSKVEKQDVEIRVIRNVANR